MLPTGCGKESAKPLGASSAKVFSPAPIRVAGKTADVVSATVRIEDYGGTLVSIPFPAHQEARRLEDAFHGLREGTRSPIYGAWIGFAVVEFRYEDGSVESIVTNFEDWQDSERRESTVSKGVAKWVVEKLPKLDAEIRMKVLQLLSAAF
jgi:hypothetical protein